MAYLSIDGTSLVCFSLLWDDVLNGGWISRALIFLGQWSLPIYLTHYFFLPGLLGMNDYLGAIAMEKRLSVEIFTYSLGALMTLIPTLPVIWLLKRNPYLDYFFYGETGRLSSKG